MVILGRFLLFETLITLPLQSQREKISANSPFPMTMILPLQRENHSLTPIRTLKLILQILNPTTSTRHVLVVPQNPIPSTQQLYYYLELSISALQKKDATTTSKNAISLVEIPTRNYVPPDSKTSTFTDSIGIPNRYYVPHPLIPVAYSAPFSKIEKKVSLGIPSL